MHNKFEFKYKPINIKNMNKEIIFFLFIVLFVCSALVAVSAAIIALVLKKTKTLFVFFFGKIKKFFSLEKKEINGIVIDKICEEEYYIPTQMSYDISIISFSGYVVFKHHFLTILDQEGTAFKVMFSSYCPYKEGDSVSLLCIKGDKNIYEFLM